MPNLKEATVKGPNCTVCGNKLSRTVEIGEIACLDYLYCPDCKIAWRATEWKTRIGVYATDGIVGGNI